ncbi:N-acyl homoserine lactonase family protein [Catenuloplanes indicus]|uniref:Glyoxylase-like metal-dependent hydrolase (Beta-lactamase superfamily II) n=1 Tax=Catenuloplanes indicus TaxID=137267 RepID=A0AAE3VXD4_9ACTN|nr:N-acyl homoserine lactonase family protein [Catenuloplanes indicus]MDQ0365586.1 glyoxylase-like metal-dependent hydrolase (beta-lactamase superfamily II) [Catenuloplanes indicus]
MGVTRIIALTLGWEDLPRAASVHGASRTERVREPVPGLLLEHDDGWLLIDTGFNTALLRDPALRRRFYPSPNYQPELPGPGEPIEETFAAAGIDLRDVTRVALSHLHVDHAGGLKHFAGRVPVHAQRAELDYGLSNHPEPERYAMARVDYDDPRIDWRLADGDTEIVPGVTALLTAGHTPGHQSFLVHLDGGGGYVFACDAADLTENIAHERAIGSFRGVTAEQTVAPIRRLKGIGARYGYPVVPGHDPIAWPALTAELAARFRS